MTERDMETTSRPHHKDPKPDRVFRHAVTVTSAALAAAVQTGIKDGFAASHRPYHTIHGDTTKAGIAQAGIRAAVPACAPHRATSLLLRNGFAGGSDMTKTDTGRSRESGADAGPGRGRKRGGAARAAAGTPAVTCRDGPAQAIPRRPEAAGIPAAGRRRPRAGRLHSSCGAARWVCRRAETLRSPRRAGSHRPPRAAGGRAIKDAAFILPSSNTRMGTIAGGNRAGVRAAAGRGPAYPAGGPAATSKCKRREFQKRACRPSMPGPVSGYSLDSTGGGTAVPDMPRRAALIGAIQNINPHGPAAQGRRLLSWDYRRRPGGRACNPGSEPACVRLEDARATGHGSGPGRRMDPGAAQGCPGGHGAATSCDCGSVATHRRSPLACRSCYGHAFKRQASVSRRRPCPRRHDTIRTKPKPCRRRLAPGTPDFHIPEASA